MKRLSKLCVLCFTIITIQACAAVNIQSQLAPDAVLSKLDPIYLETGKNLPIAQQKYVHALNDVLNEEGFNTVPRKSQADYIMNVDWNDFQGDLYQSVPDTQTTIHSGSIGGTYIHGTSTKIGSETIHRKIPTHNSTIKVRNRKTGQNLWEVSMAKSYDVYNHDELKDILTKMLSLYGKDDKAVQIVSDDVRW